MSPNIPSEQNRAALVRKVGAPMFFRGEQYAKKDMVLEHHTTADGPTIEGTVRGSGGVTYRTSVYLTDGPSGSMFDMGVCTCPVGLNCKHAVALLLVTIDNTIPSAPTPLRTWQAVLNMALPAAVEESSVPLGIQLSSNRDSRSGVSGWPLTARIVRPGKTGWVNDNLAWSSIRSSPLDAAPGHLLLSELYVLYESGGRSNSRYSHGYGAVKDIDLTMVDSTRLWLLLEEARELGIELVHQGKRLGALAPARHAHFMIDVIREDDAKDLAVQPRISFDGRHVLADDVGFIGEPSHGLFTVDPGTGLITLARLDTAIPRALRTLLVDREPLVVPVEDHEQFEEVYLPRLQRAATVVSSNESFTPPVITGPLLQLIAAYAEDHRLDLRWQWSYMVGAQHRHCALDSTELSHYRNLSAERQILDRLDIPFEEYGLRTSAHTPLRPFATLSGMDTVRASTELIPLLRTLEDLEVIVEGSVADYREAGDSMQIGLTTTSSKRNTDWFDLGISITVDGQDVPLPEILAAIANGDTHLLLDSGAYISLDKPELQALRHLVEEARALQDKEFDSDENLRISRFQAGLWEELAGLGVVERQAASWQRQVQGLLELESIGDVSPPPSLQAQLRPYQLSGFQWLAFLWTHRLGGILADDMGLGKTVQTLAMICHALERQPSLPPFLILAPTSVVPNWADEAAKFAPHLKVVAITETRRKSRRDLAQIIAGADIVISSYTLFRLDFDSYDELDWSSLILDEAQFAKNHQSKLYQCARLFNAPFKLAITGTPMENNLMELWSLLSLVAPGLFPSPKRFTDYYRIPIERGGDAALLAQLRQRIRPLVLRRTKEQVVSDLPEKWEQVLEVDLHPRHRELYDTQLKREQQKILGLIDDMDKNRFTILRSLTILRQLCLDASLVDEDHAGMPSAKIDALAEHLHDVVDGGHRALVFSQFTSFLGKVRERLEDEGIEYCYLDGSTRDRAAVLTAFKSGQAPVFLISLKSGGFGLNLTEADYCFIMDPWWNPATEAQAIDRTHRIGQTRNVMVYRLIARDTIEDKVMELKARKFELFSSVLDDGGALSASINADDIRELLA